MKPKSNRVDGSVIDLLYDEFKSCCKDKSRLLVFHGSDRGVNSSLCKQLCRKVQEDRNLFWAYIDFKIPSHKEIEGLLISLRNHFNREFGVVFPSFDIACAFYLFIRNSDVSPMNQNYPLSDGKSPLKSIARAVRNLPVKSFIPVLNGIFTTPGNRYKQWWLKRGKFELVKVSTLEPVEQLQNLAGLWLEDYYEFSISEEKQTVIFLDSFENLVSENDAGISNLSGLMMKFVNRIRDMRLVVMSDTELVPNGKDAGNFPDVKNISVDKYIGRSSFEYLKQSGISDGNLIAIIEKECAGIPYLLNLAVDIFREITSDGKRTPCPGDFSDLKNNAHYRLLAVLDDSESFMLKLLSHALSWDEALLKSLALRFNTAYPGEKPKDILRFSFVNESGVEGFYSMDENVRSLLNAAADKELSESVYKFLFEYHDNLLTKIDFGNITDVDKNNFHDAFYYAGKIFDATGIAGWCTGYFSRLMDKGHYRYIHPYVNELTGKLEKETHEDSKELAGILLYAGIYYKEIGKYRYSEKLLNRSKRIFEKLFGEDSREVAGCIIHLADVLFGQGEFGKAEPLYLKAIVLLDPLGDKENAFSVKSIINLAILFARQGNYDKAVSLFEKILSIRLKSHGDGHPDVMRIQTNIANIEFERKNYITAEKLYRGILDSKKIFYGDNHPEVAKAMTNLGNVLLELENYDETTSLYERAREIFEEYCGREHPDYAMTLNNLAYLNFVTGKYDSSKSNYLQALNIYKNILGDEHPDLAILYNNIGTLYTKMKEYSEAEVFLKKSLEININKFGPDKPGTQYSYQSLAEFNESTGNFKKALFYYEKYESILKKYFPNENPDLKDVISKIAYIKSLC